MPISSDLEFDARSPPRQWLTFHSIEVKVKALCLWDMTIGLIHNEAILSKNPERFLAMIHEHKVGTRALPPMKRK